MMKQEQYLVLGGLRTALYAYRINDSGSGIFFVESTESGESSGQVNFTTHGIILNASGNSSRDWEVSKLMAKNVVDQLWDTDSCGVK